jgi:hypothetical protein
VVTRVPSRDLGSSTDVAATQVELVEAVEAGDLQRVGAAIGLHVGTGKRLARAVIEPAGAVL